MRDFSRYRKFASNGSEGPSRKGETKAVRFLRREKSNIVVGGDARLRHPVSDQELKEDCVASFAVSNGQVVSAIGSVAQATNAEPVDFIAELNILKKGAPNALLPPASPFDLTLSTSWVARKRILLEQLKLNLMKNPKQAVTDMQVQSVWKICFKAIYDLYRSLIRKAETNPTAADATTDKIKAQNACQLFLDESNTYFSRLIYSLSQFWLPNATEICKLVEPKLKIQNIVRIGNRKCDNFDDGAVRCILHQLLVCKGDILRYSKKFDQAEDCYRKSLLIEPRLGQSYNLIALVKIYTNRDAKVWACAIETLYYYVRSMAIEVPYPWTRGNLHSFLNANINREKAIAINENQESLTLETWTKHLCRILAHQLRSVLANLPLLPECYGTEDLEKDTKFIIQQSPVILITRSCSEPYTLLSAFVIFIYLVNEADSDTKPIMFNMFISVLLGLLEFMVLKGDNEDGVYQNEDDLLPTINIAIIYIYKLWMDGPPWFNYTDVRLKKKLWIHVAELFSAFKVTKRFETIWSFQRRSIILDEDKSLMEFIPLKGAFRQFLNVPDFRNKLPSDRSLLSIKEVELKRLRRIRMLKRLEHFIELISDSPGSKPSIHIVSKNPQFSKNLDELDDHIKVICFEM